jgi:hypothetical protein
MRRVRGASLVALLLLPALLLAACGGDAPRPTEATPAVETVAVEEPAAATGDVPVEAAPAEDPAAAQPADESEPPREAEEAAAAAAGGGDAAAPAPVADAAAPAPVADAAAPDPRLAILIELTDPADEAVIDRIGATVAERRGLALLEDVPVYLLRRAEIPAYLAADEEVRAHEDAFDAGTDDDVDQRIFALLGLIGDDVSLDELFEDFFVGLGLGFYDFDLRGFVIISANDHVAGGDVSTITHEFVHVLQDQHFAISDYFEAHRDNQDRVLAARFVVEGDATNSERLFRDLESDLASRLEPRRDRAPGLRASVPPLLQTIFTAPYTTGARVIAQVLRSDGQAGVDALLAEFPPSTEQLLHPDKLAAGERPLAVDDPDVAGVLGAAWAPVGSDTLGEFVLRTLLGPATGDADARRAAAGWGGDRLTAYRGPADMSLLVWELRWDTAADAEEMMDGLRRWLPARTGAPVQELAPGTELRSQGASVSGWVRRSHDAIFVVIGEDAAAVKRVGLAGLP